MLEGNTFDLSVQAGVSNFFDGVSTSTYGINGSFLGPVLKVRKGDHITLNVKNNLSESTTMHWHGMHLPGEMDGGPHQLIEIGETWKAQFTVDQKAGTNWFHPHQLGQTGHQVYMGLAGLMIVEDVESDALDLPKTWAEDDFPVIIQDRRFRADGNFDYLSCHSDQMHGMQGDVFLVNGTVNAKVDLPSKEVRLRILNGSNARIYNLKFSDGRSFKQIATDTAFKETPLSLNSFHLSPGERTEIIVDLSSDSGNSFNLLDSNSGKNLLALNVNKNPVSTTTTPSTLTSLPQLDPASAVTTRPFVLEMKMGMGNMRMGNNGGMRGAEQFSINGVSMDMARIDHSMNLNDVEIWEIKNNTYMTHNFHVHATHFSLLERNGSMANVAEYEKGYKDVVMLNPEDTVKIIIQMINYKTDSNSPYMFHCHILEHEDRGMMGQFTVV